MRESRAATASRKNKHNDTFEQLQKVRAGEARRTQTFSVKQEEAIFEMVDEKRYEEIKRKRGKSFVVDNEEDGYQDDGEEIDWDNVEPYEGDEAAEDKPGMQKAKVDAKKDIKKPKEEPANKNEQKIQKFFGVGAAPPKPRPPPVQIQTTITPLQTVSMGASSKRKEASSGGGGADTDKMLESLLGELDADVGSLGAPASKRPSFGLSKAPPPSLASAVKAPPKKAEERPAPAPAKGKAAARTPSPSHDEDVPMSDALGAGDAMADEPVSPAPAGAPKMDGTSARSGSSRAEAASPTSPISSQPSFPPKSFTSPAGPSSPPASSAAPTSPSEFITSAKPGAAAVPKKAAAPIGAVSLVTTGYRMLGEASEAAGPEAAPEATATGPSDLPIEEDGSMKMYWIDAYEDRDIHQGRVYVFGKVKPKGGDKFVSCCAVVDGTVRNLFFLPRDELLADEDDPDAMGKIGQVAEEVTELLFKAGIKEAGMKPVLRNYAFEEEGVPRRPVYYLKVQCSQKCAPLPDGLSGKRFSRVFGTRTSALELLLLKRKLMGPCWIRIANVRPSSVPVSWAKLEALVDDVKAISPIADGDLETPPLTALSLAIKTVINPKTRAAEVVMVHGIVHPDVRADGPTPPASEKKAYAFAAARKVDFCPWALDAAKALADARMAVKVETSERGLLSYLIAKMSMADADVLVGHRLKDVDLDVLLHRMHAVKAPNWSKLGRLKRTSFPKMGLEGRYGGRDTFQAIRTATAGRLICDTYDAAKDLLREKTYDLGTLVRSQYDETVQLDEVDAADVAANLGTSDSLLKLMKHTEAYAYYALQLMFQLQVMPLSKQLTNLAGNLWARSLHGARAERNEYLLLHEFHALKYIVPDKYTFREKAARAAAEGKGKGKGKGKAKAEARDDEPEEEEIVAPEEEEEAAEAGAAAPTTGKGKRKPAYAGGLVLEPKRGLYDKYVLLLDFNSLYPSIIQEYNICFTTVRRQLSGGQRDEEGGEGAQGPSVPTLPDLPGADAPPGVLPRVIRVLVDRRRQVKALIKAESDHHKLQQLDIRQKALKLTANSMYGCLGFQGSRFYARPIAELITSQGRETLQRAVDIARSTCNLEVIYGDTDSVMIHTGMSELAPAKELGQRLKREVNKLYKHLEIELDGVFSKMLLLRKKKYAALKLVERRDGTSVAVQEEKGLDLVRRDWCPLSVEVGRTCLGYILKGDEPAARGPDAPPRQPRTCEEIVNDIHGYLREVRSKIDGEKYDVRLFAISKSLTRAPDEYPDAAKLPHVTVAKQLMAAGKALRAGEIIQYVICANDSVANSSLSDRAYALDTVLRSDGGLKPDYRWYLQTQIHPPVARLCEPIEGTGAGIIAECLGMDGSKFAAAAQEAPVAASNDEEERFKGCEPLRVVCSACRVSAPFPGVYRLPSLYTPSVGDGDAARLTDPYPFTKLGHLRCTACAAPLGQPSVENQLLLAIGRHIERYYEGWMRCEEQDCLLRTRSYQLHHTVNGRPACPHKGNSQGHFLVEDYSAGQLYTQLLYFQNLFDVDKARERLEAARKRRDPAALETSDDMGLRGAEQRAYRDLRAAAARFLAMSAYGHVNLGDVFRRFTSALSR